MQKKFLTISLILFGVFTLLAQDNQTALSDEEYIVISSIKSDSTVIINETIPMKIVPGSEENDTTKAFAGIVAVFRLKDRMPELSDETVKDFNSKNEKAYPLERKFILPGEYTLIKKGEALGNYSSADDLLKKYEIFREKYPKSDGFISFSRVGFSSDKKQALAYFEHFCGVECASGEFFFFVKEKDKWIKKAQTRLWIS